MNLTFGAELEWSDIDSRKDIPKELGCWEAEEKNEKGAHYGSETWIINSDGSWADPLRRTDAGSFGGEINMRPTDSVDKLVENFAKLKEIFPEATTKSTSWGHIVVGFGEEPSKAVWNNIVKYVKANEKTLVDFTGAKAASESLVSDLTLVNGSHIASCWLTIYKEDKLNEADDDRWENLKKRPMYYLPTTRSYEEGIDLFLSSAVLKPFERTKSEGIALLRYPTKGIIEFRCFGQAVEVEDFRQTALLCERIAKEMVKGDDGEPIKNFINDYKYMKPWFNEDDFKNLLSVMNEFEKSDDFQKTKKFKKFHSFE